VSQGVAEPLGPGLQAARLSPSDSVNVGGLGRPSGTSKLDLPAHNLQVVSVNECDGHFLLSLNKGSEPLRNLQISTDNDYDYRDPVSYAVVTRSVVDIGYRCSPATWTSDGPRIRIEGKNSAGIPFEQFFSFLP
jgi:hypothetical protein